MTTTLFRLLAMHESVSTSLPMDTARARRCAVWAASRNDSQSAQVTA
jgi:hypothetical protein